MMTRFEGNDRRQFVRVPFQKNIKYRICYDRFVSEIVDADSHNISQNGILFKTKYPPQVGSVLALNVPADKFGEYLQSENLTDIIDPEQLYSRGQSIFGEVIRNIKDEQSGFFSVAVKLILKKDPEAKRKVESTAIKDHPQYIDPTQIPDEEKARAEEKPAHPQYIDPSLADEDT